MTTRVLHFARDLPPATKGGVSIAVEGILRATRDAGCGVTALSHDDWRPRSRPSDTAAPVLDNHLDNITLIRISSPAQLNAAIEEATRWEPSVVHVHDALLWPAAAELAATVRAPTIYTAHVLQAEQSRLRGLSEPTMSEHSESIALAEADLVVAPSSAVAAKLSSQRNSGTLEVIGMGVHQDLAADPGISRDDHTIVFAGRLADIKGLADLLAALPAVLRAYPSVRAELFGGLPGSRKFEKRWEKRWRRDAPTECVDRVTFRGWTPRNDVLDAFRRAAVVVAPSWFETFGMSVLEALAVGSPVVATDVGGLADLVDHERNALVVPAKDSAALAAALVRALGDRELRDRLGQAAAAGVDESRRWPAVARAWTEAYRKLTQSPEP